MNTRISIACRGIYNFMYLPTLEYTNNQTEELPAISRANVRYIRRACSNSVVCNCAGFHSKWFITGTCNKHVSQFSASVK